MKCILGIGNPGERYRNTRHNVGFQLLDYFVSVQKLKFKASKFDYYFSEGEIDNKPFVIVKPTTYVNNTGVAIHQCLSFYGIIAQDLLVLVDDINLSFGEIRLRKSGGDGGHNGLTSIIYHLNTEDFPRLRFGIDNDFEKGALSDYVLSQFNDEELGKMNKLSELSSILISSFIIDGYDFMLAEYSRLKNIELKENRANNTNENQE
ncbi:MAG: aminoacyl-tRNA hydrolase [Ignavibacteriaceae bacterium]|nr:aminoacyl-tRNA hydrolase [Ignavibacteriaceae bacterium]